MNAGCLACGAAGCRGHHPTGRSPDGLYLDHDLRLALCHDDHELAHDDWRMLGIQDADRGQASGKQLAFIERVELRLRRLALTVGRLAEAHPDHRWLAALARALKRWADELARDITARDNRDTGWRSDPAFYPTPG